MRSLEHFVICIKISLTSKLAVRDSYRISEANQQFELVTHKTMANVLKVLWARRFWMGIVFQLCVHPEKFRE